MPAILFFDPQRNLVVLVEGLEPYITSPVLAELRELGDVPHCEAFLGHSRYSDHTDACPSLLE